MKKYIEITVDVNDGDYITEITEITDQELEIIIPVIEAIREFNEDETIKYQKYNWHEGGDNDSEKELDPYTRYVDNGKVTEESYDYFNDYLPRMGYESIHTIESIKILEVIKETSLL